MIGLIMAGGKGTRMNSDNEKLLLKYKKPVILHVVDSLNDSKCFSNILALTSLILQTQKNYCKKIILKFLILVELDTLKI